jgi:hypothetical protein
MNRRRIDRRTLLRGLGASVAALPFLGRIPSAIAEEFPKRFVVFFTPNDAIDKSFWQPGAGLSLTPMMKPLEPYKSKLVVLGELEMQSRLDDPWAGGHIGTGHVLVGRKVIPYGSGEGSHYAAGISVDQHIAKALGVEALVVGARVNGTNGNARISYLGANEPVPPIEDPVKAFAQVLGDYSVPPDQLAELHAQRRSVLDAVAGHLDGVIPRLAVADRYKLEQHLDHLHDLEKELDAFKPVLCDPQAPTGGFDYKSNADYPVTIRKQMDVVAQALACDVTRVATVQIGNSGTSHVTPVWPSEGIDINIDAHNISHNYNQTQNETNTANRVALEKWYFEQFAYFLQKLDEVAEGEGTLLDHTLVLWCKPIGRRHLVTDMLFLLAGSAGGALETGRYLAQGGKPHNDLLTSCCQLMGLADTEFGDPAYCNGPLAL